MNEVLDDVDRWQAGGQRVAIARVVGTEGSSPRDPGAAMAVSDDRRGRGLGVGRLRRGRGRRAPRSRSSPASASRASITFGYSDDDAFAVGLTCGGTIHLFVEPLDERVSDGPLFDALRDGGRRRRQPVALVTVIDGAGVGAKLLVRPDATPIGHARRPRSRSGRRARRARRARSRAHLARATTARTARRAKTRCRCSSSRSSLPPRMIIFGAVDFTAALARSPSCSASVSRSATRGPCSRRCSGSRWPTRSSTSGPTATSPRSAPSSGPATRCACSPTTTSSTCRRSSRRCRRRSATSARWDRAARNEGRVERLREAGLTDAEIARVMSPIGLDIGARTPEETAIAICAEVIAHRTGRRAVAARHCRPDPLERGRCDVDLGIAGDAPRSRPRRRASATRSPPRSSPKACRSPSAGANADTIEAAAASSATARSRSSPTSRRRRARPGSSRDARAALGGVDILVANAGGPPPGNFASVTVDQYLEAFELNCRSTIAMCYEAVPAMREQQWGRVVAITSIAVRQPIPNLILSNTARAGLTGFLRRWRARSRPTA